MGVSKIDAKIIEQSGSLVSKSGYIVYEYAVRRIGKIVHIKGYAYKSSGTFGKGEIAVFSVSGVPLPSQTTRFTCSTGTAAYDANTCCYGVVTTNGDIHIKAANESHNSVIFNFWYPVD